ncbi:hypothetical protein DGWBC_0275 [Dehalogenimonas sp. WBC-2]|nr:hypothetical protein DGWBC_0275 [Dehalogenimonas sp. WBC-2]
METPRIGIVCCAAMQHEIKDILKNRSSSVRIYPMIPSCTFTVRIDLFRHYIDKSVSENEVTVLAYGLCHPELLDLLSEYGQRLVRVGGDNCWEMSLGLDDYLTCIDQGYWMQSKPFLTLWRTETLHGFGVNSKNGQMLRETGDFKILFLKQAADINLTFDLIDGFAKETGLGYEIKDIDSSYLTRLLTNAIEEAIRNIPVTKEIYLLDATRCPESIAIIEHLDVIIYKIDVHTKEITYASSQVKNILGYNPSEFIGMFNESGTMPMRSDLDKNRIITERWDFLVKCLTKGFQKPFEAEYSIKHKDGHYLWVNEKLNPTFANDGTLEYFVGLIEKIDDRKHAEEQLQSQYEKEVNLRNQIENQMQRRIELTRALVHELKTPLTAILAASEIVSTAHLQEPYSDLLRQITQCANHLDRRIEEMFDVTKGEVGLLKVRCHHVESTQVIREVADCMRPEAIRLGCSLVEDVPLMMPRIWADEERLKQILFNLLSNALKVTPKKGVITIRAREVASSLVIQVFDTGCGISVEDLPSLFNPYRQLGNLSDNKGGLGLGLALSQMLVQLHGGKIWAESELGRGSVLSFSLPLPATRERSLL